MESKDKELVVREQGEVVTLTIDDSKVDDLLAGDGPLDRTWWRFNSTGFTYDNKPVASSLVGVIMDFEKIYKKFDGNKPPERLEYKRGETPPEDFELRLELGIAPANCEMKSSGLIAL